MLLKMDNNLFLSFLSYSIFLQKIKEYSKQPFKSSVFTISLPFFESDINFSEDTVDCILEKSSKNSLNFFQLINYLSIFL